MKKILIVPSKKIILLMSFFIPALISANAVTTLADIDFTDESNATYSTSNSSATYLSGTYDGVTMLFGVKSSKPINVSSSGLSFESNNYNTYTQVVIPIEAPEGHEIEVTLTSNGAMKYVFEAVSGFHTTGSTPTAPSATQVTSGTAFTYTMTSTGKVQLHLGRAGSDAKLITKILIKDNSASSCTAITPSLSYAGVGGTTLSVGDVSSGAPDVTGNTGGGTVTYTSSNTSVATVASNGVVTAVAAGSATITASIAAASTYCSGSATANFTISAGGGGGCGETAQTLSMDDACVLMGGTVTMTATSNQSSEGDITYTSSNTSVATVNSSTGVITPVAAGSATITAEIECDATYAADDVTATVQVKAAPALSYATTTLNATGTDYSSNTPSVTGLTSVSYTSSNTSVATVNSSTGVITPVATGSATITATGTNLCGATGQTATRAITVVCVSPGLSISLKP